MVGVVLTALTAALVAAATIITLSLLLQPILGIVAAASISVSAGVVIGLTMLVGAVWFRLAIQYADEHNGWTQPAKQ
jgi:hypothetical protein